MRHQIRWTIPKIKSRLALVERAVYRQLLPLPPFRYHPLEDAFSQPPVEAAVDDSAWPLLRAYDYWARARTNFILRTPFTIPSDWGAPPLALYLPLGDAGGFSHPEALVYLDGRPLAATDRHHHEVALPPAYADGRAHTLALHGWTGNDHPEGDEARLYLRPCHIVQIDAPTRAFAILARTALGVAESLPEDDVIRGRLLNALEAAFIALDLRPERLYDSIAAADRILRARVAEAGPPSPVTIAAAGHAHIDVAWLWTLGQTRQKARRTFYTVLHLMEQFPDYIFTQSQPQLYAYLSQDDPDLLARIKDKVAQGRWEPIGGMWVEADCNLSGAEALARQFLLGRALFKDYFGPSADAPVLWLPDVFGYSWALPQLIKKAGLQYFMTIKIGWSQYNRLPYDSFWWQGIDGTRVLTHFSTTPEAGSAYASTYNALATPQDAFGTWRNFQQKEQQTDLLMAFGYGDGGGGPTREMLENIAALRAFPAAPQMRHEKVGRFFQRMEAEAGPHLPVWNGELYLEYHRGTYTTQARNKRANRKCEFLLHDAEFLASFAWALDPNYPYPQAELNRAWRLLCLNQFHDIIPGSSIAEVYSESLAQYAEIERIAQQVREQALVALRPHLNADLIVVNPTSFTHDALARWQGEPLADGGWVGGHSGNTARLQTDAEGAWLYHQWFPAYSLTALRVGDPAPDTAAPLDVGPRHLENRFLRVEINDDGDIIRIYDKIARREVLPQGATANQFQAFEDRPLSWPAWDIDIFYDDKRWLSEAAHSIAVVAQGPLRATLEIQRRILDSPYTQRISLDAHSPLLRFDTQIDWRERHTLLKVAFPVDILSPVATYDIQWGNVQRPTHRNTSWDWARFETVAHKWADLAEGDYGVSLLNDCKYGHDIRDNVLRLTLLRSPDWPDPHADAGHHHFTYALLPGRVTLHNTVSAAYALNNPLMTTRGQRGDGAEVLQLLAVDNLNIIVETVKRAEDGRGIIVRLYENYRTRGVANLFVGFPLAEAYIANLLEEDERALDVSENRVRIAYKPYEIITLRLVPRR